MSFGTLVVILLAGVGGPLLAVVSGRFVPVVIGEILAGILVGPTVLNAVNPASGTVSVTSSAQLVLISGLGQSAAAGTAQNVTVTLTDNFGNVATGYVGTVHFTSSDPLAVLPANIALANGSKTVSVKLKTAGDQTITATDVSNPAITGTSAAITVH